jgi:hypothetical protein
MRMPWTPSDQSSGDDAGSKLVRRVTAHSSEGSSRAEMGLKRVSSKALEMESQFGICA